MSWINDRKPTSEDADERGIVYVWLPFIAQVGTVDIAVIAAYSDIAGNPWHPKPKSVVPAPYVKPETAYRDGRAKSNHWSKGGTGVTNFHPSAAPKYEAAIQELGDSNIFLMDQPMLGGGENGHYHSLHTNFESLYDLSDFWAIYFKRDEFSQQMADCREQLAELIDTKIKELFPNQ